MHDRASKPYQRINGLTHCAHGVGAFRPEARIGRLCQGAVDCSGTTQVLQAADGDFRPYGFPVAVAYQRLTATTDREAP